MIAELLNDKRLLPFDQEFTQDFEELTAITVDRLPPGLSTSLNEKMAVIAIDGNAFGKREESFATTVEAHREWDSRLQAARRAFLGDLIKNIRTDPTWLTDDGKLRMETLLWGGDEMVWVVPAWCGWSVLERFFSFTRTSRTWNIRGRLTHSVGIVFCSYKSPIRDAVGLAGRLVDEAKQANPLNREEDRVAYQILESFDHIGGDFAASRIRQSPAVLEHRDLPMKAAAISVLAEARSSLPISSRRRHRLHRALLRPGRHHFGDELDRLIETTETDDIEARLKAAASDWNDAAGCSHHGGEEAGISPPMSFWYHLCHLWDYLPVSSLSHRGVDHE